MAENDTDSWPANARAVCNELKRLANGQEKQFDLLRALQVELAVLKVKAGVWGMAGGLIPVAIALVLMALKK